MFLPLISLPVLSHVYVRPPHLYRFVPSYLYVHSSLISMFVSLLFMFVVLSSLYALLPDNTLRGGTKLRIMIDNYIIIWHNKQYNGGS